VEQCYKAKDATEEICALHSIGFRAFLKGAQFLTDWNEATIAFATLIVARFTGTLWRATTALKDGADDQLTHAKEATQRQLRAYVSASDQTLVVESRGAKGKREARFEMCIENFGSTPAHDVEFLCTPGFSKMPIGEPMFFGRPEISVSGGVTTTYDNSPSYYVLHQREKASVESAWIDIEDAVSDLVKGRKAIFMTWRVTYKDVFNDSHFTQGVYFSSGEDFAARKVRLHGKGSRAD
jgi:hypothetical protein